MCGGPVGFSEEQVRALCSTSRRRLAEDHDRTAIHYRFRPFAVEADIQRGTVTVGIAIQDPTFYEGTKRLTVILSISDRLHVYEDDVRIIFDLNGMRGKRKAVQLRSGAKIEIPKETDRKKLRVFVMTISFKSGLKVKISEAEGVMNPAVTKPRGNNAFVGLLGQGDGNQTNEFITLDGTVLPIDITSDATENSLLAVNDTQIFFSFGNEWKAQKESSLFGDVEDVPGQDFNSFDLDEYVPEFGNDQTVMNPIAEGICAEYEDTFIRQSCIFDFSITGNEALVRSTSDFAVEEKVIQTILVNTPPGVRGGGRSQNRNAGASEVFLFDIESFDIDGDTITANLTRNDDSLFELSEKISVPGTFEVRFLGTSTAGTYRAHVTLTDDIIPVLVTTTVKVTTPPTTHPSETPSSSPSISPTLSPISTSSPVGNDKSNSNIGIIAGGLVFLNIVVLGL